MTSTLINPKKATFIMVVLLITTVLPSCSQKPAAPVIIGNKQFVITTMESGKPETAVQEQMVFADSLFDNLQCHEWGFTGSVYTAKKEGENYTFEATMPSATEGSMQWSGMIMGDSVHGNMTWHKDGQQDIQYVFHGSAGVLPEKKEISLDGKAYFTTTMVHGKPETAYTEDWTFDGGTLRSPSCEIYGFLKSPYKAWEQNGVITMESLFQSEKEGYMNFTATIKDKDLTGNVVWHKEGQNDMTYDVTGKLK